ncbi:MAG TPA: endolytic transglycosylase MltG [Candidatus Pullilachnospira intestinigallinarum]|nr:endolytic transglycosylase MltG [Candidatus Pullilachnospira intestinigallinarum]
MGNKKKKDRGYRAAVAGAKGIIKVLIYIVVILLIVLVGRMAYSFGYLVFDQRPATVVKEEGDDVTVVVKEGDTAYDVGKTLVEKGLSENALVFWVQEQLSDYKDKIRPGTYILNTADNVDEMLAILSGEDTEGQPSQTEEGTEDASGAEESQDSSEAPQEGADSSQEESQQ